MKVSELTAGPILNNLTAIAQEWVEHDYSQRWTPCSIWVNEKGIYPYPQGYQPSDNSPAQAFELIEKFKIYIDWLIGGDVRAQSLLKLGTNSAKGSTPAEAICKAVICATLGDELDEGDPRWAHLLTSQEKDSAG
ncbi:MAG: hypothetical protein KAR42_15635 [candidate division Zixibacteria bacterium]|nr:hypothetical protein [candidate division Zixibacteria bacterium]